MNQTKTKENMNSEELTAMVNPDNKYEMTDLFNKVLDYVKVNGLRNAGRDLAEELCRIMEVLSIDHEEALLLPILFSAGSVTEIERKLGISKMDMLYYAKAINRLWYDGLIQYAPARMGWTISTNTMEAVLHSEAKKPCDYSHMTLQELAERVESCIPVEYDMRDILEYKREKFCHIADRMLRSDNAAFSVLDGLYSPLEEAKGRFLVMLMLVMVDAAAFHNNIFTASQLMRMVKKISGESCPYISLDSNFVAFMTGLEVMEFDEETPAGEVENYLHLKRDFARKFGLRIRRQMGVKEFQEKAKAKSVMGEGERRLIRAITGMDSKKEENPASTGLVLTKWGEIEAKNLYYNAAEKEQVDRLTALYDNARMQQVVERLAQRKRALGFITLFYGAPGTGKTETCYQLALQSHRDIYSLDVSQIKTKWYGESESNLKAAFQEYADKVQAAKEAGQAAPILLLNEADSIICKRVNSPRGGEQSTNAMQNILLQEFEKMEGVVICTTNLTCNMDAAFERRFLFKVEFHRPDAKVRAQIWQDKVEGLSAEDAQVLGEEYDFSGGEIDNIAKKADTDAILFQKEATLESLRAFANEEHICRAQKEKKEVKKVGFLAGRL